MKIRSIVESLATINAGLLPAITATALVAFGAMTCDGAETETELGRIKVKTLQETSGIAASRRNPDVIWLHNDGEAKHLYAVTTSGRIVAQVKIPGEIEDLEDIAIVPGPEPEVDYLYLGDIGDNDSERRDVKVVRMAEPALNGNAQPKATQVETYRLRYPDGSQDAEALMVDPITGDLVIGTKEDGRTRLYSAPAGALRDGETVLLQALAGLDVEQVSAGDISRDGHLVALRREDRGWLWERRPDESLADALKRRPRVIPVRGRRQGDNGESIAFAPDSRGYYTLSEGKNERLCLFELPGEVDKQSH